MRSACPCACRVRCSTILHDRRTISGACGRSQNSKNQTCFFLGKLLRSILGGFPRLGGRRASEDQARRSGRSRVVKGGSLRFDTCFLAIPHRVLKGRLLEVCFSARCNATRAVSCRSIPRQV